MLPTTKILFHYFKNKIFLGLTIGTLLSIAPHSLALTSAGTQIQGQTLGQYTDDIGNTFTAQSNIAIVTVQQVYAANIGSDATRQALSNSTANFSFLLTNTGNGLETFILTASDDSGDSGDFASLRIIADNNSNGVADAGEPEITEIALDMEESVNILLSATLPTAATGSQYSASLTIGPTSGVVDDLTAANGADGLEGTVQGIVTVDNNAIIEINNAIIVDDAAKTITQTLTVSNVGGEDAHNVVIFTGRSVDDLGGGVQRMADITTTSAIGFDSGVDPLDVDGVITGYSGAGGFDEANESLDFDGDGNITDVSEQDYGLNLNLMTEAGGALLGAGPNLGGAYGVDNILPKGTSVKFKVIRDFSNFKDLDGTGNYGPTGGIMIPLQGHVSWDIADDGDTLNSNLASSNITLHEISSVYGINLDEAGSDGVADNTDTKSNAEAGQSVSFSHTITNTGNSTDTYEVNVDSGSFPANTVFQIYGNLGSVLLLDTNGNGQADTGPIASGDSFTITVEARLPAGLLPTTTPMTYTLNAISAGDNAITADSVGQLGAIITGTADLSFGLDFSGFNPVPPPSGAGSCGTGDAFTDLADAKTVVNKGRYCFDLGSGEFQADVDTGAGQGWVLVLQYIHKTETDPGKVVVGAGADLPHTSDAALTTDGSLDASSWGHAGNSAMAQFTGDIELRWYAESTNHNRITHFYSTEGDDYVRTGSGSFDGIDDSFIPLQGHTGILPAAAMSFKGNKGDYAMTEYPFYNNSTDSEWIIGHSWTGNPPKLWRTDDIGYEDFESTIHRVWVRSKAEPAARSAPTGTAATSRDGAPGETISFDIFIENDGSAAQVYTLGMGASHIGGMTGAMLPGWSAVLKDNTGATVTTTSLIPAGGVFQGIIEVTIPTDPTQALLDYTSPTAIDDSGTTQIDGNFDGDFDYPLYVAMTGSVSGLTDILLNAIDISEIELLEFGTGNTNIVRAGAMMEFSHTLTNAGNTDEEIAFATTNSTADWNTVIYVDTTGNGEADNPLELLTASDSFYYVDREGNIVAGTISTAGIIPLPAGGMLTFNVRNFAPSNAADGALNTVTITASYNAGANAIEVQDQLKVSNAQMQLYRTASVDAACADIATPDLGPDAGFDETTGSISPGGCIIWQVTATNTGEAPIHDVNLSDSMAAFTLFQPGTLRVCLGDAGQSQTTSCTFTSLLDANDSVDEGYYENDIVRFVFGEGSTPILPNGTLPGGQTITVRYAAKVE